MEEKKQARPVFVFEVPKSLQGAGVTSVGLVEITQDEELLAAKRSHQDGAKLAYELTKASLVQVNGKPVSLADGTVDTAMREMGPKLRALVLQAYVSLHASGEEETASFLASRQVQA